MMTLKKVISSGVCVFCNKEKEVVSVVMDGQKDEVLLCWGDVKKHAQMRMRMTSKNADKSDTPLFDGAKVAK